MLKRGETPNAFIVYFSICSFVYKNPPRVRPARLLPGLRSGDPAMVLSGLFCVCLSSFSNFFFYLFSTTFCFASCFILFIPL